MNAVGLQQFQKSVAGVSIAMWNGRVVMDGVTYEAAVSVGRRMVVMKQGGEVEKRTITVQVLKTSMRARPVQGAFLTDKGDGRVYQVEEIEGDRVGCPVWVVRGVERDR